MENTDTLNHHYFYVIRTHTMTTFAPSSKLYFYSMLIQLKMVYTVCFIKQQRKTDETIYYTYFMHTFSSK